MVIENNKECHPTTRKEREDVRAYAKDVLGSLRYTPWLYVFTAYRGEFKEGWIPPDFYRETLPLINTGYRQVANAKTLSSRVLSTSAIPDEVYLLGGRWFDKTLQELGRADVEDKLLNSGGKYFVKMEESSGGKNVFLFDPMKMTVAGLEGVGNFVVQRGVDQHQFFDQFSPGSLGTIRILTGIPRASKPRCLEVHLRVGREGHQIYTAAGGIMIPVDKDTGVLGEYASDRYWKFCTRHPDTGASFFGKKIPNLENAVSLCEELHNKVSQFAIIGWDVAIDRDGETKVLEWNARDPGIKFCEPALGPCFREMDLPGILKSARGGVGSQRKAS
ncbi:sugar-transfer associated ATP-grasp domain-containing protein [Aquisalimonas asiatica]|nr:sugar-transfer associated ATP-grasp domain-containing protein [Aquisalimonas asiatica]